MEYTIKEKFDLISKEINEKGTNAVNYLVFADCHIDEYLRKAEDGSLTTFEADEIVEKRISMLQKHLEEAAAVANMPNLDWNKIWVADVSGGLPRFKTECS